MNLFKYTSKSEDGKEHQCTFNTSLIVQTAENEKGELVIALNEWHSELRDMQIPVFSKTGEHNGGYKREIREVPVCTNVVLSVEDKERFYKVFLNEPAIHKYPTPIQAILPALSNTDNPLTISVSTTS